MGDSGINPTTTQQVDDPAEPRRTAVANVDTPRKRHAGESTVIWTLWFTYGAFYLCRQNISAAVPGMKAAVAEGGLGLSPDQIGWILAALKIVYGLGQFLNGQLSERMSPRVMLAIGMFGSAALNVVFGLSTGFYFLLFVWAMNGFCQSLGWTPCVRVAANWIPIERRGYAIGIIGTGYQIALGITFLLAGQAAELLGWRGALYVPAVLLTIAGVFMLLLLREKPDSGKATNGQARRKPTPERRSVPLSHQLHWTLYNPALWLLGMTLGLLNACRYGYFDWGLTHLVDTRDMPVGEAVLEYFVIAIGATAGSYIAGWATDRYFGSRRAPVVCALMVVLGCLSFFYESAAQNSVVATMLLLVAIGFCIMGPQVLLVGTAPADLAHRGTAAAAAGFVNFMGYIGAATGVVVTGYYVAPENGGWRVAIYMWAGWAFAGAAIMAILWNTTSEKVRLLPSSVPKIALVSSLFTATAISALAGQPRMLTISTLIAAVASFAAVMNRWAILPAVLVSCGGIIYVFTDYVQSSASIRWDQISTMILFGASIIASMMILVEQKDEPCV